MIKTTLTKLKKAYSTLSFAPRALGTETNGKFYRFIVSLLRRSDKCRQPDKTEEEEYERGEVIANLMLEPSDTAALFSRGLSKPEALQTTSFLAPPVDNKQREKSTFSKKDESKQNDLDNPVCKLQGVAVSMPKSVPLSMIQPETEVNKAQQSGTETHRQETVFGETKKFDPPNSLQNAIPDIILDKNNIDDCPDRKTTDPKILCSPGKKNSNGNTFNNLPNTEPVKVNNMLNSKMSSYIQSRFYDGGNDSPSIKLFASHDKTIKPPSTETNSTLDELAKHCLDSPNNKIDERLLKEMKKLGVSQTSPRSENSVIEENIIQMDVLRKPRKPTEKTEIDVETRKFEHPPLNYSDEQRLEFEPSAEEEKELLEAKQNNKKDTLVLQTELCTVTPSIDDGDKPLLNPFDKKKNTLNDWSNDAKNCYHTEAPVEVQLEKTNKPLKSFHVSSRNYTQKTDNRLESTDNKKESFKPSENPSNPPKLSMDNVDNANHTGLKESNAVDLKPKSKQDSTKLSEGIVDKVTMSSTHLKKKNVDYQPKADLDLSKIYEKITENVTTVKLLLKKQNAVNYQPEDEMNLIKQSGKNADIVRVNNTLFNQDAISVADEPHGFSKLSEDKVYMATINSKPLKNSIGVDLQAKGELAYSKKSEKIVNQETEKTRELENISYDPVPKIPEPLLVFNPPEQKQRVCVHMHTNQIDFPRSNADLGTDHDVTFVKNLKSLQIRCQVLPTKNTDEKATVSLLVEIDAIKQPNEEFAARHQPDVTYREDSADQEKNADRSIPYLNKIDHITRDKVTMILPKNQEKTNEAQVDSPEEKPEIPLSEMLKRVRSRHRAEYCHQLEKTLEHELNTEVETITGITGKCGDKKPRCPPRCPPPCPPRCPPSGSPPSARPACPRPCKPACPPPCPHPCPKSSPSCGKPSGNPCCPGSSSSSSRNKGNPCCPASPSSLRRPRNCCKFSMLLPTMMMNSVVSLIDQHLTVAESELAQNQFFMVTKDAYQRFLYSAYFAEIYRPHLLPILNICGNNASLDSDESMNSMLARDYDPWVPIPCWPVPKKEAKKPWICPKEGCQIPLPGKNRPPCNPYPCRGFPKRKNSFSIIDLYACWSNPNSSQ